MVNLECDSCGEIKSFPSTLTVVDTEIDGWVLEISEVTDSQLKIDTIFCQGCQESEA